MGRVKVKNSALDWLACELRDLRKRVEIMEKSSKDSVTPAIEKVPPLRQIISLEMALFWSPSEAHEMPCEADLSEFCFILREDDLDVKAADVDVDSISEISRGGSPGCCGMACVLLEKFGGLSVAAGAWAAGFTEAFKMRFMVWILWAVTLWPRAVASPDEVCQDDCRVSSKSLPHTSRPMASTQRYWIYAAVAIWMVTGCVLAWALFAYPHGEDRNQGEAIADATVAEERLSTCEITEAMDAGVEVHAKCDSTIEQDSLDDGPDNHHYMDSLPLSLHVTSADDDQRGAPNMERKRFIHSVQQVCLKASREYPAGIGELTGFEIRYQLFMSTLASLEVQFPAEAKVLLATGDMFLDTMGSFTEEVLHLRGLPEALHRARRARTRFDFSDVIRNLIHQALKMHDIVHRRLQQPQEGSIAEVSGLILAS